MATRRFTSSDAELDVLYKQLSADNLQPLWEQEGLLMAQPVSKAVAHRWAGKELRELGARAGDLVPIHKGGDRRVLSCSNPGLDGSPYTLPTLWASMQYLCGFETAPPHRHTAAAVRFILAGDGVWTVVDGDPVHMSEGDLILTPNWTFHGHYNATERPMMWLDVLDLPLVLGLDSMFFEQGEDDMDTQALPPRSISEGRYGFAGLAPSEGPALPADWSPLLAYRWVDTEPMLNAQLAAGDAGYACVRYVDPARGRDVMPTMRCEMTRVRPGSATDTVRQTGGRIICVLHGTGRIVVGTAAAAQRFDIEPGDVVAIPSWSPWSVRAEEQMDLFSVSDAPVLEALGLFRSARLEP